MKKTGWPTVNNQVAPPHVPSCCDPGDISGNAQFEVISVISVRQGRPHLFLHLVTLVMLGCPSCPNQDRFLLHVIPWFHSRSAGLWTSATLFKIFPAQLDQHKRLRIENLLLRRAFNLLRLTVRESIWNFLHTVERCWKGHWVFSLLLSLLILIIIPTWRDLTLGRMLEMYLTQRCPPTLPCLHRKVLKRSPRICSTSRHIPTSQLENVCKESGRFCTKTELWISK